MGGFVGKVGPRGRGLVLAYTYCTGTYIIHVITYQALW